MSDLVQTQSRRIQALQFSYRVILRKDPDTERYDKTLVGVARSVHYWKARSTAADATRFMIIATKQCIVGTPAC